jgi:hypothetical protein
MGVDDEGLVYIGMGGNHWGFANCDCLPARFISSMVHDMHDPEQST